MAKQPTLTDYVALIMQLFEQFMQHRVEKQGINETKLLTYSTPSFIVFFMVMQFRVSMPQNAMAMAYPSRWLQMLGWQQPPHRTTIARRYKALYEGIPLTCLSSST